MTESASDAERFLGEMKVVGQYGHNICVLGSIYETIWKIPLDMGQHGKFPLAR